MESIRVGQEAADEAHELIANVCALGRSELKSLNRIQFQTCNRIRPERPDGVRRRLSNDDSLGSTSPILQQLQIGRAQTSREHGLLLLFANHPRTQTADGRVWLASLAVHTSAGHTAFRTFACSTISLHNTHCPANAAARREPTGDRRLGELRPLVVT